MNSSYVSKSKLNISSEGNNNDRMVKLADKLSQITNQIQNEKVVNSINMSKNQ